MAHFAEIDSSNKVVRVLVVDNSEEHRGQDFLANDLGLGGTWIQTSYNANFRGKYAAIGNVYNKNLDVFEISAEEKAANTDAAQAEADKARVRAALLAKLDITTEEEKILFS